MMNNDDTFVNVSKTQEQVIPYLKPWKVCKTTSYFFTVGNLNLKYNSDPDDWFAVKNWETYANDDLSNPVSSQDLLDMEKVRKFVISEPVRWNKKKFNVKKIYRYLKFSISFMKVQKP